MNCQGRFYSPRRAAFEKPARVAVGFRSVITLANQEAGYTLWQTPFLLPIRPPGARVAQRQSTMTDETNALPVDDETSLLDLLLVVAENARLLIFGPILAGLAALGIAFVVPPTFTAATRMCVG